MKQAHRSRLGALGSGVVVSFAVENRTKAYILQPTRRDNPIP